METMTDTERRYGAVRYDCLRFAMQTAARGEDAMTVLARAQLYAEFVLPRCFDLCPNAQAVPGR